VHNGTVLSPVKELVRHVSHMGRGTLPENLCLPGGKPKSEQLRKTFNELGVELTANGLAISPGLKTINDGASRAASHQKRPGDNLAYRLLSPVASTGKQAMTTAQAEPRQSQPVGIEVALVARARLGDEDAIAALVHAHAPRLRWVAWRVVRNWADAEDLVQVTLWKAYQHLPDYQEHAPLSTWLTRIALNEGVGLLRKRRTQPIDLAEPDAPLHQVQWPATHIWSPEQILASNEIHRIVRSCMERMRPDYRAVL
jgi:RNA polymerase sigma factor (sigma-70 family)